MKKYLPILLFALVLTSCSPFALVNSEVYNNAKLEDYHTFRIVTPDDGSMPPGMTSVTYYNIAAAIREQMVERGFVEDPNSPILVNIGLTIHREITTEPLVPPGFHPYPGPYFNGVYPYFMYPRSYYYNYYKDAQVITGIYKEGVLTMDIVNIKDKLPLYSSSVATIIQNSNGQFRNLKEIAEAVQTLFSKFPVPVQSKYSEN